MSGQAVCIRCEELDEEFVGVRNKYRTAAWLAGWESPQTKRIMEIEEEKISPLVSRMIDHKARDH